MRLFDLVEQHDLVGTAADRFGQSATFLVTDIAWRRADQPGPRNAFSIYSDISMRTTAWSSSNRKPASALVSSVLPTPVGAQEQEGPDRPCWILQARRVPCARRPIPHARLLFGRPRAWRSRLFHPDELFAFALQHLVDRNTGPARTPPGRRDFRLPLRPQAHRRRLFSASASVSLRRRSRSGMTP